MNRYTITCFLFASFLSSCKPHSKPSLIGKWRIIPDSYPNSHDSSGGKKTYFEFDSGKLTVIDVYLHPASYIKNGDTIFSDFSGRPNEHDTTIIKLVSSDTAIVKNRHGEEDFYIVREKQ